MTRTKRRLLITLAVILSLVALAVGAAAIYLGDYYRADEAALAAYPPAAGITESVTEDGDIVVAPASADVGLIFYPGGKVEHRAYLPLCRALAERGILCVIVEMPFRLAVLDVDAADGIPEQYPSVKSWYIGGHSLGGSMAASYLADHPEDFSGLCLLASYSTADLSDTGLSVLSVYGSADGVLNMEKYEEYKGNLPAATVEAVLDGGCHAYFGAYGAQSGDGTPTLTLAEQIAATVGLFADLVAADPEYGG